MVYFHRYLFAILIVGLVGTVLAADDEKPRSIKGWGKVIDTAGDCSVKGDENRLTIEVPGGTHDLGPFPRGLHAPRVLKEVEGDFSVQVKVTGDFRPGEELAPPAPSPFNGAGLLIWQDSKNFIRLERNAWWPPDGGGYACYPPLFEYYWKGQFQYTNPNVTRASFFKGRSTWLKLERRGGKVSASYSHDGKEWTEVKQIDVDLPRKVQVGVAAVNTSTKPFVVRFQELALGL
jgi:hypothetical protein